MAGVAYAELLWRGSDQRREQQPTLFGRESGPLLPIEIGVGRADWVACGHSVVAPETSNLGPPGGHPQPGPPPISSTFNDAWDLLSRETDPFGINGVGYNSSGTTVTFPSSSRLESPSAV